jgi:hypothetical protein
MLKLFNNYVQKIEGEKNKVFLDELKKGEK